MSNNIATVKLETGIPMIKRQKTGLAEDTKELIKNMRIATGKADDDSFEFTGSRSQIDTVRRAFTELGWRARILTEETFTDTKPQTLRVRIWRAG